MEEHWCTRLRPREIDILLQPLGRGDTVLEGTFVEHIRREFGQAGVHSILYLQTNGPVAEENEPFEERLSEASSGGLLAHDGGSQLGMICTRS